MQHDGVSRRVLSAFALTRLGCMAHLAPPERRKKHAFDPAPRMKGRVPMKRTKSGKIACTARHCQRIATHRVTLPPRGTMQPYPRYYCDSHARSVMSRNTSTLINFLGFTVVPEFSGSGVASIEF